MTPELYEMLLIVVVFGFIGWLTRRILRKQAAERWAPLESHDHGPHRDWYREEGGEA